MAKRKNQPCEAVMEILAKHAIMCPECWEAFAPTIAARRKPKGVPPSP